MNFSQRLFAWATVGTEEFAEASRLGAQQASIGGVHGSGSQTDRAAWVWPAAMRSTPKARGMTDGSRRLPEDQAFTARLLAALEDAIIATDDKFVITAWNHGAQVLFGWTAAEAIGRPVYELLPQDYSDLQQGDELHQLVQTGRWRGERTWFAKDGTPVAADGLTVAVAGQAGEVAGYLCLMRDIRQRMQDEAELAETHRRVELLLRSIADPFYAVDAQGRVLYVNAPAVDLIVRTPERPRAAQEVVGQTLWSLLPEGEASPLVRHYRGVMETGRPVVFESRYPAHQGRWYEVHAAPFAGGISALHHDVTDRKQGDAERRRSIRRLESVADLGLYVLMEDDAEAAMSRAVSLLALVLAAPFASVVERLPGGQLRLRAGVGWDEGTVGRTTAPGAYGFSDYTIARGEAVAAESLACDRRFERSAILAQHDVTSAVGAPVRTRRGTVGVLAAFSRERRRFSRDEMAFVQSMANVVAVALDRADTAQRIRDVREDERRRMARALHDEALQDLSYVLAEAVLIGPPAADIVTGLTRIGRQLRGAIYDLRLGDEEHRPFPELLRELISRHLVMGDHDIQLELGDGTPAGSMGTKGIEILRIIGEALTNARRHAGGGCTAVRTGGSKAVLWCEVADEGVGMPSFEQEPVDGRGIKTMRERAALIGGHLKITSTPDQGTVVRLELQVRDQAALAAPVRVLLLEDHTAVREALAAALEKAGLTIVGQAATLSQARAMLRQVKIDVAVIDLRLPDGDGADLIEELRSVDRHAQALVLSAAVDRSDMAHAVDRGAAAVLPKTTPLDEVVAAVLRLRAGETLLPVEEVVDLLRLARRDERRRRDDLSALAALTPREREILQLLADGLTAREMADRLHIAPRTHRNHVANILAKLGVHSQLQAVMLGLRYDVLQVC